jgi:hypothetical protein
VILSVPHSDGSSESSVQAALGNGAIVVNRAPDMVSAPWEVVRYARLVCIPEEINIEGLNTTRCRVKMHQVHEFGVTTLRV